MLNGKITYQHNLCKTQNYCELPERKVETMSSCLIHKTSIWTIFWVPFLYFFFETAQ